MGCGGGHSEHPEDLQPSPGASLGLHKHTGDPIIAGLRCPFLWGHYDSSWGLPSLKPSLWYIQPLSLWGYPPHVRNGFSSLGTPL